MAITGEKRERIESSKIVGLFEADVICINPSIEDYKEILGMELKEDSKATEYLGERDGNTTLRIDVWLKEIKTEMKLKVSFFLEDKERENKDETKKQYINDLGSCSWAEDPNQLKEWFVKRTYRVAKKGEEELYNFLRTWFGKMSFSEESKTELALDWKRLMRGNVKELTDMIGTDLTTPVVCLATVAVKEKDGEINEYQSVYNKAFLPPYFLKFFRTTDYSNEGVLKGLQEKKTGLKAHERFVLTVTGEYGCKDFYILKDFKEYVPEENPVATSEVKQERGTDGLPF